MPEGTDASISSISQFGADVQELLGEFSAGATTALTDISKAVVGASGLAEGALAASYHGQVAQHANALIGDAVRGVQLLSSGALAIAVNYLDADARQQSEMSTVFDVFNPTSGPTVSGAMAEAAATQAPDAGAAQRLRTTGEVALPAPTTTGPAAQTAAQAAQERVEADREEYGQDAHQDWVLGHDDLVDAPEPEPVILAPGAPGSEPATGDGTVVA